MPHRLLRWFVAVFVVVCGGYMAFDGAHYLLTGDYVTPAEGPHAGQLGPWAAVVEAVGLVPRSGFVAGLFVGYGLLYLASLAAFLRGGPGSRRGLMVLAALGLWYLPFGTLLNLLVLALLWFSPLRHHPSRSPGASG